jgi:hypothetical protein
MVKGRARAFRSAGLLFLLTSSIADFASADPADEKTACIANHEEGQAARTKVEWSRALHHFQACSMDTCPGPLRKDCLTWSEEIQAQQPSILITVRDFYTETDVADPRVTIDGQLVTLSGVALPLDPGRHTIHVKADGYPPTEMVVLFREGEKRRIVQIALRRPEPPKRWDPVAPSRAPWAAIAVGGGALAFAGAALAVGLSGTALERDYRSSCGPICPASDVDTLRTRYAIADTLFGLSIVSAVIATVLWITHGPSQAQPQTNRANR